MQQLRQETDLRQLGSDADFKGSRGDFL